MISRNTRYTMTMDEYQSYIWDKIDSFPFHPTRPFDEWTIKISDKCWDLMKSATEYEEKDDEYRQRKMED